MKLPVHVLRRIDYYEIQPFVEKKYDYFNRYFYIIIYWKPVTKKFFWWTTETTETPKRFKFRCTTKNKNGSNYWIEPENCVELRYQLAEWFDKDREELEIESMIDDLLNKDEH